MEKQAETIASESFKKDNGRKGFKIRAIRDPKEGLKIEMSSTVDFDIFKRGDGKTMVIGGVRCAFPRQENYPGVDCPFVSDSQWEYDSRPNLSLILAEGIRDGVVFNFGLFPLSEEKVVNYLQEMKRAVNVLYLSHCKKLDMEVNITFETVERFLHH